MKLASIQVDGTERLGIVLDTKIMPATSLGPGMPDTMAELLAMGPVGVERLSTAAAGVSRADAAGIPIGEAAYLPPVTDPSKIIAIGLNYRDHATEAGLDAPTEPLVFAKFPNSLLAAGRPIRWDPALATVVDFEAELAVIIGSPTRDVTVEKALSHVLGYACCNDVSARDLQFGDGQWVRGKSLDTFFPIGPYLVTTDEIPDPQDLAIRCYVNSNLLQDSNTSKMFFGVAEIISHLSKYFTLYPGDIIATGTPAGVGVFREPQVLLGPGSEVVVEIEGLGRLSNPCVPLVPVA
jgi:2-keto-4-pentenoate hydratase/2-oxohepta-3-ene-1,7-dioic acid hydratase in catechol pathway